MILRLKPLHYAYLSAAFFLIGTLFYGFYNEILIIRMPFRKIGIPVEQGDAQRKKMKLTYWNGHAFSTEEKELLFSAENAIRTLTDLVISWLSIQEQEQLIPKKVTLQSIFTNSSSTEAFISFDRNPLLKEKSTFEKLMWIEGLLKTLKESGIPLISVTLLVHSKPLQDHHLDFTHPWPITGYQELQKK